MPRKLIFDKAQRVARENSTISFWKSDSVHYHVSICAWAAIEIRCLSQQLAAVGSPCQKRIHVYRNVPQSIGVSHCFERAAKASSDIGARWLRFVNKLLQLHVTSVRYSADGRRKHHIE